MSTATLCDTLPGVRRKGKGKEALSMKYARSGPIFDDPAGVDVSEARIFLQHGDGGGSDGTFGSGGVLKFVGIFEVDEANFCDWGFGLFEGWGEVGSRRESKFSGWGGYVKKRFGNTFGDNGRLSDVTLLPHP